MNTPVEGMAGEPLPYLIQSDWIVTTLMFCCILLVSFVVSKEKKYLLQQLKSFFVTRERSSMFDETNVIDTRYTLLLTFHTCILLGFSIYHYLSNHTPALFETIPHASLLGGLIGSMVAYLSIRCMLYSFINWIFFQKASNSEWMTSFFNLFIWLGILLLPLLLVIIYFDISSQTACYLLGGLIIFAKITLFWKCFCNFFEKIHGAFHLILYFCALEILPDLLFWKGMELLSNNLILNL